MYTQKEEGKKESLPYMSRGGSRLTVSVHTGKPAFSRPPTLGFGKEKEQKEKGRLKSTPCEEQQKAEQMVRLLYPCWVRMVGKRGLSGSQTPAHTEMISGVTAVWV